MALKVTSKVGGKKPAKGKKRSSPKSSDVMKTQLHSAVAQANKIGKLLDKTRFDRRRHLALLGAPLAGFLPGSLLGDFLLGNLFPGRFLRDLFLRHFLPGLLL